MIVVVDASVAAMWFLPEEHSPNAALLLDSEYDLAAPDFLYLEVASALLKATRRGGLAVGEAAEALQLLAASAIRTFPATEQIDDAFHTAERHGGSLYDATYIAGARSLAAPIVTNDAQLAEVARKAGVRAVMIGAGPPGTARKRQSL